MADSIYNLAVRLSLEGIGVTAAANMMMRQFASLEGSARSLDRTVNGLRFTLNTEGAATAADQLMQTYRQLEVAGTRINGLSGADMAAQLDPLMAKYRGLREEVGYWENSMASAGKQAETLATSLDKMERVYQRGIPGNPTGAFDAAGNPLTYADTSSNRLYAYTAGQHANALSDQANALAQRNTFDAQAGKAYGALQGGVVAQANALQAEQERQAAQFNRGMGLTMAGATATAVGGMGLSFFKDAAKNALDYNGVMTTVRLNTGATADEMQRLRDMTLNVGLTNQMSETDVAKIMRAETQSGVTNPTLLATLTPHIANLAEVANFTKGADRSETATMGVQLAHLFGTMGVKDPVAMGKMIDLVGRASQVTPGSLQQFDTLISQFIGNTRLMYPNQDQLVSNDVEVAMVESFLGQKGRGGTGFSSMISRMAGNPSFRSVTQRKKLHDIESLGGQDFFQNGQLVDFRTQVQILETAYKNSKSPQAAASMFNSAFGAVGTRVAGLLADPRTMQALDLAEAAIKNIPSMQSYQQQINATPQGQINQANANLNSAMTEIGTDLIPLLGDVATAFANVTRYVALFTHYAPGLAAGVVQFLALGSVMLLIVGPIALMVGSFMILAPLLAGITIAGLPLIGIMAALVVGIPLLVVFLMHLQDIIKMLHSTPALGGVPNGGAAAIGPGGTPVVFGGVPIGLAIGEWLASALFGSNPTHKRNTPGAWVSAAGQLGWAPVKPGGGGGPWSSDTHVHGGVTIHVHAQPHHDAHQIAHEVEKVLSNKIGQASRYGNLLPAGLQVGSMGY